MVIVMKTVMGREAYHSKTHHVPASYTLLVQQEDYSEKDLYDMTSQVMCTNYLGYLWDMLITGWPHCPILQP